MILQVSGRTDICALYPKWFVNRLKAGYVLVRNPYNNQQDVYKRQAFSIFGFANICFNTSTGTVTAWAPLFKASFTCCTPLNDAATILLSYPSIMIRFDNSLINSKGSAPKFPIRFTYGAI